MKIDFKTEKSPYDPEFVAKILRGVEERKSGKTGLKIDVENMWK